MPSILNVPELGEGVDAVEVVKVLVAVGDSVEADQPVIEVETEKASVEIPSELAGTVTEIHVKEGDSLTAGAPILAVEPADGDEDTPAAPEGAAEQGEAAPPEPAEERVVDRPPPQGDGTDEAAPKEVPPAPAEEPQTAPEPSTPVSAEAAPRAVAGSTAGRVVAAAPTVRRFAREVGVDIAAVSGSGPGGRISIDDVKTHAARLISQSARSSGLAGAPELPDFETWGPVRREPMSKVRRVTARNLARAWQVAPQVTHNDWADITDLEPLRKLYRGRVESAGGKLTVTSILVKVVASALKSFPNLNASVDQTAEDIIFKDYVHIGVAVDTEHGLLVPVIRDADRKNITEISVELDDLAGRARNRKLAPADMQGGTFSISNLGGIGGTGFSPIVNWPEVAILGVSRSLVEPRWDGAAFQPRSILPLSLSYDHRLVDGAEAARFLRWIAEALEQPLLLALEG